MKIPTVKEIREIMLILNIEPVNIAESLDISVRTAYRMISSVNEPSIKDRAAVAYILYEFSKEKGVDTPLSLQEDICKCEEPESYESEQIIYLIAKMV